MDMSLLLNSEKVLNHPKACRGGRGRRRDEGEDEEKEEKEGRAERDSLKCEVMDYREQTGSHGISVLASLSPSPQ